MNHSRISRLWAWPRALPPPSIRRGALLLAVTLALAPRPVWGQTQRTELRFGATGEKILIKDHLRLALDPEVRTDAFTPDEYLLQGTLKLDPWEVLALRAGFRGVLKDKDSVQESSYRTHASVGTGFQVEDFEPSLRLMHTFQFGPEEDEEHRLRYRAQLEFDIPSSDWQLSSSAEAFQQLGARGWFKMRYAFGVQYKFYGTKKLDQYLSAGYMLDYFLDERLNVHIPNFNYRIRF